MHPQARFSEIDEAWHIYSPYGPSSGNGIFFNLASTSGVRAPPGAEASFYSLQGYVILRIFICLSFQKCIINGTFAVKYLKCYSYNVRHCLL